MTVSQTFAEFAANCHAPSGAREAARRCLLDTLGGTLAGGVEMPAAGLARVLPADGPCRLLPRGVSDVRTAALINGMAAHTVEVDDIFREGLYHPGVCVVPAALAVAEAEGAGGGSLIDGIIAGYEVSNRIARAVNPAHYRYWHTTATVGHFGAAVAAGRVMGLSAAQHAHALGTVATMAAGLRHAFSAGSMTKPLHAGRAAEAGVLAALSAKAGVTGVMDMFEGVRGFGAAMSEDVDWQATTASLETEWTVTQMTQKFHACCGHNFAALDAIGILMAEHGIAAGDIDTIDVGAYRATVDICGEPAPRTAEGARFSLPYCAGVMALRGAVVPGDFSDTALADPSIRDIAAKVTVTEDAKAEAAFPARRSAMVTIRTQRGATHSHRRPTRKGDPDDPLSDAELMAKFHGLANPVIGADRARQLAEALATLDTIEDVRTLPLHAPQARAAE
ncbi:MAG: MmgE/PrpD family protein [Pseudomonadota bacterium]